MWLTHPLTHICINNNDLRRPEKPQGPFKVTCSFVHSLVHANQSFIKPLTCTEHYARLWTPSPHRPAKFHNLFSLFKLPSRTQHLSRETFYLALEIGVWLCRQSRSLKISKDINSLKGFSVLIYSRKIVGPQLEYMDNGGKCLLSWGQ